VLRISRDRRVPLRERYRVFDPVAEIDPGTTLVVETINHMTPIVESEADVHPFGTPEYREREETGPILVRGADPGDMLAVCIDHIELVGLPHAHLDGPLGDRFPATARAFAVSDGAAQLTDTLRVPLAPMVGDIYTTPVTPEPVGCDHGGNMDCTEVRPGHTLYLPVFRPGGLLVLGDVHAFQGEGEISGEGGECAADVTITVDIDRRYRHPRPLVETPEMLITLASRGSVYDGLQLAVGDMTNLLVRVFGWPERDAYTLCTMVGSLRFAGSVKLRDWVERNAVVALSVPKSVL
jgi:amidase